MVLYLYLTFTSKKAGCQLWNFHSYLPSYFCSYLHSYLPLISKRMTFNFFCVCPMTHWQWLNQLTQIHLNNCLATMWINHLPTSYKINQSKECWKLYLLNIHPFKFKWTIFYKVSFFFLSSFNSILKGFHPIQIKTHLSFLCRYIGAKSAKQGGIFSLLFPIKVARISSFCFCVS